MLKEKGKISLKQLFFIYLLMLASPSIRIAPYIAASTAKQAGWLTPIAALIIILPLIFIFKYIFKVYKSTSLYDIIEDIFGKIAGKAMNIIYLLIITLLTALYVKYYAERLTSTVYTNTSIYLFIVPMLIFIAYALRKGITVIARTGEILLILIIVIFITSNLLLTPKMNIDNLYPITYLDIIPILHGGWLLVSIWGYLTYMLFFADDILKMENMLPYGIKIMFMLTFLTILAVLMPIGIFGWSIVEKFPIPYFVAARLISVFDVLERFESGTVSLWIMTDFIIISIFAYSGIKLVKKLFSLSDHKPIINIYLLLIFVILPIIAERLFMAQKLSIVLSYTIIPLTAIIIPYILFAVGKIRKKI